MDPAELFSAGAAPSATDMLGAEWQVTMLSGPIPNMSGRPLRHRKVFEQRTSVVGCNIMLKDWRWGQFRALPSIGSDGRPILLLDYYGNFFEPANSFVTRQIRDHLRTTPDPNAMIGKFHIVWRGKPRFVGYFELSRCHRSTNR